MTPTRPLELLERRIVACTACPRLVAWRCEVAARKRRAYAGESYWGRPVPGFGDPGAALVVLGLAPGAHGANRTGRVFTGDRSGDFLYPALHRAGLANQPLATSRGDGLVLRGVRILLVARCVPPGNAPLPDEIRRCAPFLADELEALTSARAVLALGAIAWKGYLGYLRDHGVLVARPAPAFGHGAELVETGRHPALVGSYHVSQQNTQTGRLTAAMFDGVLHRAVYLAGLH